MSNKAWRVLCRCGRRVRSQLVVAVTGCLIDQQPTSTKKLQWPQAKNKKKERVSRESLAGLTAAAPSSCKQREINTVGLNLLTDARALRCDMCWGDILLSWNKSSSCLDLRRSWSTTVFIPTATIHVKRDGWSRGVFTNLCLSSHKWRVTGDKQDGALPAGHKDLYIFWVIKNVLFLALFT